MQRPILEKTFQMFLLDRDTQLFYVLLLYQVLPSMGSLATKDELSYTQAHTINILIS